jgi:hypothetical protein
MRDECRRRHAIERSVNVPPEWVELLSSITYIRAWRWGVMRDERARRGQEQRRRERRHDWRPPGFIPFRNRVRRRGGALLGACINPRCARRVPSSISIGSGSVL